MRKIKVRVGINRVGSTVTREFEIDDSLREYYHFLWEGYDNWVNNHYNASEVLVIDMNVMDVVNNEEDKKKLIEMVENKLKEVRK